MAAAFGASKIENGVKRGQGVSAMFRSGSYWACVANVAVDMNSGVIKVEKMTSRSTPASSSIRLS